MPTEQCVAQSKKSVLLNSACVGKRPRLAIGLVRRTKSSIDRTRIAAANAMAHY